MSDTTMLEAADRYCRYLANRHYENFTVASVILPGELRRHLARIYAFARTTDDLGDERGGDALDALERWREQVEACFSRDEQPIHPVLVALKSTVDTFALPREPFLDLIAANVQDQTVSAYEDWEQLHAYCMLSAAPVGRLVLGVFRVADEATVPLSDDVCIGLQLANFAQDVQRDRAKGRTYLLQADLRTAGVPGAVAALCDRAQDLLASGRALEARVPGRLGLQLALYRLGGEAIIEAIRRTGYRTDQTRPTVTTAHKLKILTTALVRSGRSDGHARPQHDPHLTQPSERHHPAADPGGHR